MAKKLPLVPICAPWFAPFYLNHFHQKINSLKIIVLIIHGHELGLGAKQMPQSTSQISFLRRMSSFRWEKQWPS